MIITITLNPSVDRLYHLNQLQVGQLNRVELIQKMVGGKGINAARVASLLNVETIATGFLAGENGQYITKQAKLDQYQMEFLTIPGETRNCFTLIQKDQQKTEINENGPTIELADVGRFLDRLRCLLVKNQITAVSINGSLPKTLPLNFYNNLLEVIKAVDPEIKVILDTSGEALIAGLSNEILPDFIKPNENELAELLNLNVTTNPKLIKEEIQASFLKEIPQIIVSLGGAGALIKQENHYYQFSFSPVKVINTEGSGDALVGGLLAAIDKKYHTKQMMKYAIAAGTANAMEVKTGFVQPLTVEQISRQIKIQEI